jgi:predicted metal-binding protein
MKMHQDPEKNEKQGENRFTHTACPPNSPSVNECDSFFKEYQTGVYPVDKIC